jgi:hypothetical protein
LQNNWYTEIRWKAKEGENIGSGEFEKPASLEAPERAISNRVIYFI